jgi:hypothetical protein
MLWLLALLDAIAIPFIVIIFSHQDWDTIVNSFILLYTLIAVATYTTATYKLIRLQNEQFQLANRPWLYIEAIGYDPLSEDGSVIVIFLINAGKTPAVYNVIVDRFAVPLSQHDTEIVLTPVLKEADVNSTVYPFREGKETLYMVKLYFEDSWKQKFGYGSRIQIVVRLNYRAITSKDKTLPYSFAAKVTVPYLSVDEIVQSTEVIVMEAT